ncbi:MAG: hypothetical protein A2169_11280 [Deltaproteobacteria bacterium RBG_13_47_9]|nr:MAG: hypothetical protein A2169_11280 [Deltaproteobacteria bacterium RBG_13_47_9]
MKRLQIISTIFIAFLFLAVTVSSQEKYPTKPITYIVGYAPGGASEVTSRVLSDAASKTLGQRMLIVTKPGGGSAVALTGLKSEKPDGYTIGLLPTGAVTAQHLRNVSYDCTKDFTFIMQYAYTPSGLVVRADSPWKTLKEFIEYAKVNPGKIRYSTAGPGCPSHLAMEQFTSKAGIKCTHIPFEGTAPSVAAILGGHVEACADSVFWKPHLMSGKLRLLASLDEKRIGFASDVPTLIEMGYDITPISLLGIVGPKGLPPHIVGILHDAYKKAMQDPDFVKVMDQMDMVFSYRGPQDFEKYILELNQQLPPLFREIGLQKQ